MKTNNVLCFILLVGLLVCKSSASGIKSGQSGLMDIKGKSDAQNILSLDSVGKPQKANISEMAWIAGHWQGEALGGVVEEIWSQPTGNSMMGMFRLMKEGKAAFYELIIIAEEKDSLILRLKHFHSDLKGWEEKDQTIDFPLVRLGKNAAYFDGMTFRKLDQDTLQVFVRSQSKDGQQGEIKFEYKRKK